MFFESDPFNTSPVPSQPIDKLILYMWGVMLRALTEGREIATIRSLENLINASIVLSGHQSGKESVTGGKSVLHALRHAFILCRHQTTGLGARCAEGVLYLCGGKIKHF